MTWEGIKTMFGFGTKTNDDEYYRGREIFAAKVRALASRIGVSPLEDENYSFNILTGGDEPQTYDMLEMFHKILDRLDRLESPK